MKKKIIFLFHVLFFLCIIQVDAQEKKTINGVVLDSATNRPIPSVTIKIEGEKLGITTNDQGAFRIESAILKPSSVLIISSIGYNMQRIILGTNTNFRIKLSESNSALGEVIVTGFGDRKKYQIGSAVTTVSGEDIRRTGAVNPIAALQGIVPGMQVQPGIGGPQSTPVFRIRGSASLDPYGNQPLIVVDNIVMDNTVALPNRGGDQDFGNVLKDLNPDDIASVTVLKGGAVTALYGSRAQNGVIVITTKKGFSQRGLGISVTQNTQWDQPWKTMALQNRFGPGTLSSDLDFTKSATGGQQVNSSTFGYNFGPELKGQKVLDVDGREITYAAQPHNALDLFRTAISNNTNVSISGGSEEGTFRLSYSRNTSDGVTPNNNFQRNSVNFRGTQRLLKKILVDANVTYVKSSALNPADVGSGNPLLSGTTGAASSLISLASGIPRYYDVNYWKQHYIDPNVGGINRNEPTGFAYTLYNIYQNRRTSDDDNFRGSIDVRAPLFKGLEFWGNAGVTYLSTNYENHTRGQDTGFANPSYSTSINNIFTGTYRGSLVYTASAKDFGFLVQGGGEYNTTSSKYQYSEINGAIYPDVYRLSNSKDPATTSEGAPNIKRIGSLFYQVNINYQSDVSLNIYGRNDWNSTLVYNDAHGKYSYFYPGVDLSWVFTETLKDKLPSIFDYGKVRASYVLSGNGTGVYTANTGAYAANTPYTSSSVGSVLNYQYQQNTLPNQDLIPEQTKKMEFGLEFKMFNNRLGGDISYYSQDTKNQIITFGTPSPSGVTGALLNAGVVRNRGIEASIYGTPIKTTNFSWDTRFIYTRNRNTVLSLPFGLQYVSLGGGDGYQAVAQAGGDYGTIYANYGYAKYQATDGSGKPVASPLNGSKVLYSPSGTSTLYARASDYVQGLNKNPIVGSILPKFLGNWRNTFNYKNFQLTIGLDSKIGGMMYSNSIDFASWLGTLKSTLPGRTADLGGVAYTDASGNKRNDGIILQGVYQQGSIVKGVNDGQNHDISGMTMKQVVDAGYLRPTSAYAYYSNSHSWFAGIRQSAMYTSSWISVQQVSLNYDLPTSVANKIKMNGLRVGMYGSDLFFLYNSAPDQMNPYNLNSSSSGDVSEGSPMPYIRRFGFLVNASF